MSWAFVKMYPQVLWGDRVDMPYLGCVSLDDEGLDLLKQLGRVAWHSCRACYGTGFEDYNNKARLPEAKRVRDCKHCSGRGAVQLRQLETASGG
jgi:hypothetical protein